MFDNPPEGDSPEKRRQYRQFVLNGLTDPASPLDVGRGNGIIGSEGFIENIREKYLTKLKPEAQREQPHLKKVKKKFQPEEMSRLKICPQSGKLLIEFFKDELKGFLMKNNFENIQDIYLFFIKIN